MTRSSSDILVHFVDCLLSVKLLTRKQIDQILADIDGLDGAIEQEFHISAYEFLAMYIADHFQYEEICTLLANNREKLALDLGVQYYFVEMLIGKFARDEERIINLISLAPDQYKPYLEMRYR
ncbi:hypothetical protein O4H49_07665 [Kiloniella laminariae]|uniref:Uncharacterized protein n=1 Tax=Kiloniella laminariae TaxID=454162 RepID=A0ABT4LJX3_9PROT|nr:hypothetical protein [Kiloniella laminariae]MCZ4280651.1 hypothetical protein [Kiloniella laminariae]